MKLLLDDNLPHQVCHELPGHDCYTVAFMGWAGHPLVPALLQTLTSLQPNEVTHIP